MKVESRGFKITDIGVDVEIVSDGLGARLWCGTSVSQRMSVDGLTRLRDAIAHAIELMGGEEIPPSGDEAPQRPKRVRDKDGDVWMRRIDGTYAAMYGSAIGAEEYDYVLNNHGPLTVIEE